MQTRAYKIWKTVNFSKKYNFPFYSSVFVDDDDTTKRKIDLRGLRSG